MKMKSKKITALVQCRLSSTRLPGKTLMKIKGDSLLGHLVKRIKASKYVTDIVIATTTKEIDDAIVRFSKKREIKYFRGSEEDVLDRFYRASLEYSLETIVRVTPDCPMLDPQVMDSVVLKFIEGGYDYVSNVIIPTFPDGLDTEVFSFKTLKRAWEEARLPSEREHVTAYIIKHPELFRLFNVKKEGADLSWMRWTVDTESDFEFVSNVFEGLYSQDEIFYMNDVISFITKYPKLANINKDIMRNEGLEKSLIQDIEYSERYKKS